MSETTDEAGGTSTPQPTNTAKHETPIRTAIWGSWANLVHARDHVLLRHYTVVIGAARPNDPPPKDLDSARLQWDAVKGVPPGFDRHTYETEWVRGIRLISAWIVFWSSIAPLLVIVAIWLRRGLPEPLWSSLLVNGLIGLIAFPILSLFGLILPTLFIRPIATFTYWLLDCITPQERRGTNPSKNRKSKGRRR